jgi:ribosome-binding ATPase YchF (GTP1/OBG family)
VTAFDAFVAAEGDHETLVKEGSAVNRGKKHIVNDGDILFFNLAKKS